MHEFVIVHIIDQIEAGKRFTMWPLHITILPWFDAPDVDTLAGAMSRQLSGICSFDVMTGEEALFGDRGNLRVTLVNQNDQLRLLHEKLFQMLEEKNWPLKGRFTGSLFKPHITHKAGRTVQGRLKIDRLHIVERLPQGYRKAVGVLDLPL